MRLIRIAAILLLLLFPTCLIAEESAEMSSALMVLMRSTFKIQGEGALGTAFLVPDPLRDPSDRTHCILITAAHVFRTNEIGRCCALLKEIH